MKVYFIARGYPTEKYKQYGIFEFDQAKILAKYGYKVVYLAVDVRSVFRWRKWGIDTKIVDNVQIYAINIPCGRIPKRILDNISIKALDYLIKLAIKEQGQPDILHAHFTHSAYITGAINRNRKIPFVITEHSSAINKKKIDTRTFKIAREAYNCADEIIAVSPTLKESILTNFRIEAQCIPNYVDTSIFNYEKKNYESTFIFVSVGNLITTKGMDLTIKAFSKLIKDGIDAKLLIIGDGVEKQNLQSLIKNLNLENRVTLMGRISREKIQQVLHTSNCFILASETETFGLAYVEALATGTPVIATKCGGPEWFVNETNGILVPFGNLEELTQAMLKMCTAEYNGSKISSEIISKFEESKITRDIVNVYNKVLRN